MTGTMDEAKRGPRGSQHVSCSLRFAALASLTLQNGTQALLVRFSKEHKPAGQLPYLGSSVVLVVELVKLGAALVMLQARPHPPAAVHCTSGQPAPWAGAACLARRASFACLLSVSASTPP